MKEERERAKSAEGLLQQVKLSTASMSATNANPSGESPSGGGKQFNQSLYRIGKLAGQSKASDGKTTNQSLDSCAKLSNPSSNVHKQGH